MLVKIAITGGLACGKSSVTRIFSDLGAHVIYADEIVHQLLRSPNTTIGKQVIALLGPDIVIDGMIDRKEIAKKVFNHSALLRSLENILHPAVREEIQRYYEMLNERQPATPEKRELFVAEVPLLFESKGEAFFDFTIAVMAPEEECRRRFAAATGLSDTEYAGRMARQLPQEEKGRRADFIINNDGSLQALRQAVAVLYNKFLNQ